MNIQQDCSGCEISKLNENIVLGKKIIELDDYWILNHYGGGDTFLGRMALQTRCHRMDIGELSEEETKRLGGNIQRIDRALREYWSNHFIPDRIERLYIIFFLEGEFDIPKRSPYHFHIHLIPRTRKFDSLLRRIREKDSDILAWNIYQINTYVSFPDEYKVRSGHPSEQKAKNLMNYLNDCLSKSHS